MCDSAAEYNKGVAIHEAKKIIIMQETVQLVIFK